MNQLISVESLTREQQDLLVQQIMLSRQTVLQKELEMVQDKLARIEAERKIEKHELEVVRHRIDNFDLVNIDGDPQQRLNKMIRKYAGNQGITFQKAWREFKGNYNIAFRTNITSVHEGYMLRNSKKVTLPQFLTETGHIEDAIRVADKMLNQRGA